MFGTSRSRLIPSYIPSRRLNENFGEILKLIDNYNRKEMIIFYYMFKNQLEFGMWRHTINIDIIKKQNSSVFFRLR